MRNEPIVKLSNVFSLILLLPFLLSSFASAAGRMTEAALQGDAKALEKHLAGVQHQPAAGWREGYEATVVAIKANEALLKRERIVLQKDWFDLG